MKRIITLIILSAIGNSVLGQQFSLFNQQYDNLFLINPAYAGTEGEAVATLHYRSQWAGFEGHPETIVATFHMPLNLKNSAVGGAIMRDKVGILAQTGIRGSYAYTANFNEKAKLNLGLSAGFFVNSIDFEGLSLTDQSDPELSQVDGQAELDASFGALFQYEAFELGFSTLFLFDDVRGEEENQFSTRAFSHTSLIASYKIMANEKLAFKPTLAYRFATVSPGQIDALVRAEWDEQFSLGLGYRSDFGLLVTAGFDINKKYFIGYGYEYGTTGFGPYARNSHEIMIRVKFGKTPQSIEQESFEDEPIAITENEETPSMIAEPVVENLEPQIAKVEYDALNVPEEEYRATHNGKGYVLNSINYSNNATAIPAEGLKELEQVIGFMKRYPKMTLEVGGYTSNRGDSNVNTLVSRKRAQTIVEYMVEQGIAKSRLKAVGYGEKNPLEDNSTREGRILNERMEIKVTGGIEE